MTLEFWIARMGLLYLYFDHSMIMGFPGGSDGKESTCNAGDLGSVPGLGRSPGRGHASVLQYSFLENPYGQRSLEGYSTWNRKELDTTEQLNTITNCMGTWDPSAPPAWSPSSLLCLVSPAWPFSCSYWAVSNDVMHTHGFNSLLTQSYASSPDVSELQAHISTCLVEISTWTHLKPVQTELTIFHLFQRTRQLPLFLFSGNTDCHLLVTPPGSPLPPSPFLQHCLLHLVALEYNIRGEESERGCFL